MARVWAVEIRVDAGCEDGAGEGDGEPVGEGDGSVTSGAGGKDCSLPMTEGCIATAGLRV